MYDIFCKQWVSCELLSGSHYRVDSRPPEIIMREGFTGTNTLDHCFASFEKNTVFSSSSIAGVLSFKSTAKKYGITLPYLYQINASGLRGYDFSRNKNQHMALARVLFERNSSAYESTRKYQKGHEEFIGYLAKKLRLAIDGAFIKVDEVHIQGPVYPDRISFLSNSLSNEI